MNTLEPLAHLIHDKFGVALAEPMFKIDVAFHVTMPDETVITVIAMR